MMDISTLAVTAGGYILKGAASSKAATTAKEELLGGFWSSIRHWFVEDIPDIENPADEAETAQKVQQKLLDLLQNDENFRKELTAKVSGLQAAGISEKNIARKDIKRVKKIKIGDKTPFSNESYNRKNIVEGVEDANEFTLGDGH